MSPKSKSFPIRGLMVDPARLVEKHDFYFDLLPKLARWGFNTLWWHFVDDQGFTIKLDSHPELATPYAFSKAEIRRLINAAAELGIEIVPEVETLGHARFLTRLPQYAHLADGDPNFFNAACPSHPDTLAIMTDLIEEVSDLFPSNLFHAGLDEADLSGCKRCEKRGKGKPAYWLYGKHVQAIHEIITRVGKRMVMWADHVEHDPGLLKMIPKDVILAHWNYGEIRKTEIRRSIQAGFDVIGAPSMLKALNVVLPSCEQLANTENMISFCGTLSTPKMLGVVNTWWVNWRIPRDTGLPVAAYTGHLLNGGKAERAEFFTNYLKKEHGLRSRASGEAIKTLCDVNLTYRELCPLTYDNLMDFAAAIELGGKPETLQRCASARQAVETLKQAAGKVRSGHEAYQALILGGDIAYGLLQNAIDLHQAMKTYQKARHDRDQGYVPARVSIPLDEVAKTLHNNARRLAELARRNAKEWDRTRHAGDVKKDLDLSRPCTCDSLMGKLLRGAQYQQEQAVRFAKAVTLYRRKGIFPINL